MNVYFNAVFNLWECECLDKKDDSLDTEDDEEESEPIEITFFKSDTCAFCPRAEEILRDIIGDFDDALFTLNIVNVSENPDAAEEFGIFALPTTMIGGMSITGIPEPEMLMKMIIGSKITKKRESNDD
jgi:thiol-disulfide isomerase/thioredoxin